MPSKKGNALRVFHVEPSKSKNDLWLHFLLQEFLSGDKASSLSNLYTFLVFPIRNFQANWFSFATDLVEMGRAGLL